MELLWMAGCAHGKTNVDNLENDMVQDKRVESTVAIGSFISAVALAFTSLWISEEHDIAAGVLIMCAQLLMLTASIFGLDYKLHTLIKRNEHQKCS